MVLRSPKLPRLVSAEKIEKSQERTTGKREAIIRATYDAFFEKPSADVTLQEIADRAGFSKGVVMYYFKSKEEVFEALLEWILVRIEQRIRQNVSAVEGARAKLAAMLNTIFLTSRDVRRFYVVYLDFLNQATRPEVKNTVGFRSTSLKFFEVCREVYFEIITLGRQEGIYRNVPLDEAGAVISATINGLSLQWLFDDSGNSDEIFEKYKAWVFSSIEAFLAVR
jgi:TetR/AcrR family transcriptional regulator, fatty acid metabolism regulator protein